jgi:hypothetical protein
MFMEKNTLIFFHGERLHGFEADDTHTQHAVTKRYNHSIEHVALARLFEHY